MGFFATTLSICDPIGYLQKRFLNRGFLETGPFEFSFSYWSGLSYDEFLKLSIYGIEIWTLLSPAVWITVVSNFQEALDGIRKDIPRMFDSMRQPRILPDEMLTHLSPIDFNSIQNVIVNSIWYTSQTPWIVREIDKITSMCYFLIVISIFISAEFFVQDFLNSFQLGPQS